MTNLMKNPNKPILGVDLDGVCAEYHMAVLDKHPEFASLYLKGQMSPELENAFNTEATNDTYIKLKPVLDAAFYLRDLTEYYTILYITSRSSDSREVTVEWLKSNNFPNPENIIFTTDKGVTCVSENVLILVEDQIKYALQVSGMGIKVLLFDQPYNRPGSNRFDNRVINTQLIERATCWVDVMFKSFFIKM